MISILRKYLANNWFFPRYIGIVYIEPALKEARSYVQGTMLDIGCGKKRYEAIFTSYSEKYIGLDWPQYADQAHPDIVGDALRLPFKNGSIDSVLATELMEHLPSPDDFLIEVSRILRKNGAIILSVPFMEPLHEEPRDFYRFTPYSLKLLLEKHGFSIEKVWKKGGWWSVVLGSFANQVLYNWASPINETGDRNYGCLTVAVLPICAGLQWFSYQLDRLFYSHKYTLGYTIVAVKVS